MGIITTSLGFLTNFEDVYGMWDFVEKFLNALQKEINPSQFCSLEEGKEIIVT